MKRLQPTSLLQLARLLGVCALGSGLVQAQTTAPVEPEELTALRATLFKQSLSDSQQITELFITNLSRREAALAAVGDYEEARRFQQRREQLGDLYAGMTSTLVESRTVALPLATAHLTGSAQASVDTISHWRSAGSGAEWAQFRLPPGRYTLELEANMVDALMAFASAKLQPQTMAQLEFGEVTQLIGTGENRKTFQITESPDENTFTPVHVGPLTFTRSPITLRLSAAAGYPANIIRLRNLRLVPVLDAPATDSTAAVPAVIDATAELDRAGKTLTNELAAVQSPLLQGYIAQLEALKNSQPLIRESIVEETRRLKKFNASQSGAQRLSPPTMPAGSMSLDGFDDIAAAQLAPGDPEAGDRFQVIAEGKTLTVRLMWLRCPPVSGNTKAAEALAKHFGVDTDDVMEFGPLAREFTAGYLRGKPLHLLARPARDESGVQEALVYVEDVGLYQNVLVEQGLGAVQPPPAGTNSAPAIKALVESLTARENAARKRAQPPGLWALSHDHGGKK